MPCMKSVQEQLPWFPYTALIARLCSAFFLIRFDPGDDTLMFEKIVEEKPPLLRPYHV